MADRPMADTGASTEGRLAGRHALVTGAGTGIGRATAVRLAREGASVVVNYVGDSGPAEETLALIGPGSRAVAIEADIGREQDVARLWQEAEAQLGHAPDLLVNNAGVEAPYALVDMPLAEWNRVIGINLTGAFLCARECARALVRDKRPGTIVNMSSVHEQIPWRQFSHYCASKGALKLFMQTIAHELAPQGIRVVNVAPGAIATPINKGVLDDPAQLSAVESEIPVGRMGTAEEIAAAVAWLASPDASYITGTTLFVDGGMTLYPKFV